MSNNLTGDYDAVVEVRVKAINGVLATLHQNGLSKDASPTFMHRFATRVGDLGGIFSAEIFQALQWMAQSGVTSPGGGAGRNPFRRSRTRHLPVLPLASRPSLRKHTRRN